MPWLSSWPRSSATSKVSFRPALLQSEQESTVKVKWTRLDIRFRCLIKTSERKFTLPLWRRSVQSKIHGWAPAPCHGTATGLHEGTLPPPSMFSQARWPFWPCPCSLLRREVSSVREGHDISWGEIAAARSSSKSRPRILVAGPTQSDATLVPHSSSSASKDIKNPIQMYGSRHQGKSTWSSHVFVQSTNQPTCKKWSEVNCLEIRISY